MKFYTYATIKGYIAFCGYTSKLAKAIQWAKDVEATKTAGLQVVVVDTLTGEVKYES